MPLLNRFLLLIIFSLLSAFTQVNASAPSSEVQLKQSNIAAYLGVKVSTLPENLIAQLPEDILVDQGIVIIGFTEGSTAAKQGLKLYDILLAYNKQELMHPKQFSQLIKRGKPGSKVELQVLRKGKIFTLPVTLGSQAYPLDEDQLDYQYNLQIYGYDGINIKMHDNDYFTAAIRYLAPDGVVRRHNYSGYYPNIQRDIANTPDLSNIAKHDLLRAITKRKDDEDGWFGDMMPFSDGNFF